MEKEPMKNADIVVVISGGNVQSVLKPQGHTMVIRDYDVDEEAPNHPDCRQDEKGDWFLENFFSSESKGDFMD